MQGHTFDNPDMQHKRRLTLPTKLQIQHIRNLQVDNAQKALVLLALEFALVKDLDSNDGRVFDGAV